MAEKKKFKSIAFPALGTGTLGYPPCLVAKAMFDVIEDFGKVNPEHLKTVHIVLFGDKEVVQLFQNIDHWRKNKKPENVEFDIPPKCVTYVQNSLETRIMVSDRDYYRLLAYKELRIVATEQTDTGLKLEWDPIDGCFTTTMPTTKTEDIISDCFKSIIKLMETRRFHVVDICYSAMTLVIPLQRQLKILIQELRDHHDKIDQANKKLQGNKPPIINYIKVVRIFVTSDEYDGLVSAINEEIGPPKWHITEKTAFPFNIEVVGMKGNPTDLLKKIKQDVSSIKSPVVERKEEDRECCKSPMCTKNATTWQTK